MSQRFNFFGAASNLLRIDAYWSGYDITIQMQPPFLLILVDADLSRADLTLANLLKANLLGADLTRNRKLLEPLVPDFEAVPPIWELRVGDYRIFYDVCEEEKIVYIRAVRYCAEHNYQKRSQLAANQFNRSRHKHYCLAIITRLPYLKLRPIIHKIYPHG